MKLKPKVFIKFDALVSFTYLSFSTNVRVRFRSRFRVRVRVYRGLQSWIFWKASVLGKTEGNKDFHFTAKLKVIPGKPSVLLYKKSKQKENRTEGNRGTRYITDPPGWNR